MQKKGIMYGTIKNHLENELAAIKEAGLFKNERIITSPQDAVIKISTGEEKIITCRQNLPTSFYRDGSIYIAKVEVIMKQRSLYGKSISYILADKDRHVNIDTMKDWKIAEELVEKLND